MFPASVLCCAMEHEARSTMAATFCRRTTCSGERSITTKHSEHILSLMLRTIIPVVIVLLSVLASSTFIAVSTVGNCRTCACRSNQFLTDISGSYTWKLACLDFINKELQDIPLNSPPSLKPFVCFVTMARLLRRSTRASKAEA